MPRATVQPVALTIAGSDSGGGAGIQADLKTFASLGVHGTSAITCITAQNPAAVFGIQACRPRIVRQQVEAVFGELHPAAVKTGMLFSREIIHIVANTLKRRPAPPLIVDPVMVATSGARLLQPPAVAALQRELLPLAELATPNLAEAQVLTGRKLENLEDVRWAAREIFSRYGCPALVKGGHLAGLRDAADILYDGRNEWLLMAPFIRRVGTHGTGCTYSAAITAYRARGYSLPDAVARAKEYISQAIAHSRRVGKHFALHHFAGKWK